jgi:hypothetical protein
LRAGNPDDKRCCRGLGITNCTTWSCALDEGASPATEDPGTAASSPAPLAGSILLKVWFDACVALPGACVWLPQPGSTSPPSAGTPIARTKIGSNCLVNIKCRLLRRTLYAQRQIMHSKTAGRLVIGRTKNAQSRLGRTPRSLKVTREARRARLLLLGLPAEHRAARGVRLVDAREP